MIEELNSPSGPQAAVRFRPDLRVPVVTVITETDLFGENPPGYYRARQPDNEWLRVWEIPGTAHADNYTIQVAAIDTGSAPLDDIVAAYAPTKMLMGQQLGHYINFAPQHHYVVQAAIAALTTWVANWKPAPSAPAIEVRKTEAPQPVLDGNGVAQGGVRTPWVDVPSARTSGVLPPEAAAESIMAWLFGCGEPFDAATLRRLYPGGPHRVPGQLHGRARHRDRIRVHPGRPIALRSLRSPPRPTPDTSSANRRVSTFARWSRRPRAAR